MSILIRGMEMPTRCCECRLSTCHSFKERPLCDVLVEYMSYGEWETKRLDNCPLVPVPPHGDLIERDALMDDIIGSMVFSGRKVPKEAAIVQRVLDIVGDANAIIPAEEGE